MPYTLVKFLFWGIAFFGVGLLVGWLLRSLTARRELASARRMGEPTGRPRGADSPAEAPAEEPPARADDAGDEPMGDPGAAATGVDLEAARAVLGAPIELDDLTVVDGIGPKIAELCAGIGIRTWRDLADADMATLRSMLDDAGSRFRAHDPTSWPRQAELLADGRWSEFVAFHDDARGAP